MNPIAILTVMSATASLTMGGIQLRIWAKDRSAVNSLFCALALFTGVVLAGFELKMMTTTSVVEYGVLARWIHVPVFVGLVFLALFVRSYLMAGSYWLLWAFCASRALIVVVNFSTGLSLNFRELNGIERISVLGSDLTVGRGIVNPWGLLGPASLVLMLVFTLGASLTAWLKGRRQRALMIGGSTVLMLSVGATVILLMSWSIVRLPLTISFFFIGLVISVGYELTSDALRAGRLANDLDERESKLKEIEEQLGLSVSAANIGIWSLDIHRDKFWANDKWHEQFAFEPVEEPKFERNFERIYQDDRQTAASAFRDALTSCRPWNVEYRIALPGLPVRWINSLGYAEAVDGKAAFIRGATVDITKRKQLEEEAHDLGGRLIGAREVERERLARELHDELIQNIALLSVQLQMLGRGDRNAENMRDDIAAVNEQVQKLSDEVHRMSHELHPSTLEQLGLETAVRSFCREIGQRGPTVEFECHAIKRLPKEIELCLYRVAQESLQNALRHSGAAKTTVSLVANEKEVLLSVVDDGCGFDADLKPLGASLDIVSMRERMRAVGGKLVINAVPGKGTRVEASVPLD